MPTGSFVIDPGQTLLQPGQKWTFTVNAGIVLDSGNWGDDGQNISKSILHYANGSYTFSVPTDGTWLDGPITGEAFAPACEPGLAVSSNSASSIPISSRSSSSASSIPTSSRSSSSASSALSTTYVNPNPLGCSTIIPSEVNPLLYSTITGVSCVCQGTTLPLLPTVSNCGYQSLPSASPSRNPWIPYVPAGSQYSIIQLAGGRETGLKPKRALATTSSSSTSCAPSFTLTVSATLPCNGRTKTTPASSMSTSFTASGGLHQEAPVPCTQNATGSFIPPLTPEQWDAQGVDEFWKMYTENTSNWQRNGLGLMPQFFQDFSGGLKGDGTTYQCLVDDAISCQMLQACTSIATGPETWFLPYTTQAYYVWAGMTNFSKMMNIIWQALEWAVPDMNRFAILLGQKFQPKVPSAKSWSKIFPILNTLLVLLAVILIILEPALGVTLGYYIGTTIGSATAFSLAANIDAFIAQQQQATITFEQISDDNNFFVGYIEFLQNTIGTMHNSMWYNGSYTQNRTYTVTDLMQGGTWAPMAAVLPALDLNATSRSDIKAVPTNTLTNWFENMLVPNLINDWFKKYNAYVVYIPYGQVNGLNLANSLVPFTQDDCNSQWIGGQNNYFSSTWNSTVVASCTDTGMGVLYNGGSETNPPSFYEVSGVTYNGVTYNAQDMITSSIKSFLKGGFNYNLTDTFIAQLLDPTAENLNNITSYINLEPSSTGMYNLPVCRLYDLGAVPNSIQGPWPEGQEPSWPSQNAPCPCMSDAANITIDGKTSYFRDFAGSDTTDSLNGLIAANKNFAGSTTDTCYITSKGGVDCTDFPVWCGGGDPIP